VTVGGTQAGTVWLAWPAGVMVTALARDTKGRTFDQVVLEKRPLNGCNSSSSSRIVVCRNYAGKSLSV